MAPALLFCLGKSPKLSETFDSGLIIFSFQVYVKLE